MLKELTVKRQATTLVEVDDSKNVDLVYILSLFFKFWSEGKTLFFLKKKKTYEYGDVHVMQDSQDDRSQICYKRA